MNNEEKRQEILEKLGLVEPSPSTLTAEDILMKTNEWRVFDEVL